MASTVSSTVIQKIMCVVKIKIIRQSFFVNQSGMLILKLFSSFGWVYCRYSYNSFLICFDTMLYILYRHIEQYSQLL